MSRTVIGWREWVALPDLGIDRIKAKVDTGARSAALHAFDIREFESDGVTFVTFRVHPVQRDSQLEVEATAPLLERRSVRNPGGGGRVELRPVIVTPVRIAGEVRQIELTLARRDTMGFRLLLGRQSVRRRFLIDPGRSFLSERIDKRVKEERS